MTRKMGLMLSKSEELLFVCFACIEYKEMMDCPGGYSQFSSCSRIWRGKVR